MSALLDLPPDTGHPVLAGAVEIDAALDRMLAGASTPLASGDHATALRTLVGLGRRLEAVKLKVLAVADSAGAAQAAGFSGTDAWTARHTNTSRTTAARDVALATELENGHDATTEALDAGLVSAAHATVILQAASELPTGVSDQQRHEIEAVLLDRAQRFDPDQLRRIARRALETIEPDQAAVDAHENDLVRSEEATARDACTLTFHDNRDGTTSGHFTVPTLAAAVLRKVIETMTAPRRMRPGSPGSTEDNRSFDWRHRRGLAFADLLEHLPGAARGAETSQTSRGSAAEEGRLATSRRPHAAGPTEIASLSPSNSSPAGV